MIVHEPRMRGDRLDLRRQCSPRPPEPDQPVDDRHHTDGLEAGKSVGFADSRKAKWLKSQLMHLVMRSASAVIIQVM